MFWIELARVHQGGGSLKQQQGRISIVMGWSLETLNHRFPQRTTGKKIGDRSRKELVCREHESCPGEERFTACSFCFPVPILHHCRRQHMLFVGSVD